MRRHWAGYNLLSCMCECVASLCSATYPMGAAPKLLSHHLVTEHQIAHRVLQHPGSLCLFLAHSSVSSWHHQWLSGHGCLVASCLSTTYFCLLTLPDVASSSSCGWLEIDFVSWLHSAISILYMPTVCQTSTHHRTLSRLLPCVAHLLFLAGWP